MTFNIEDIVSNVLVDMVGVDGHGAGLEHADELEEDELVEELVNEDKGKEGF